MRNFKDYYLSLTKAKRKKYAKKAGTTINYIQCHLIYATKVPRPELMNALARESNGELSLADVTVFFNQPKLAADNK